jgi:hypothetical protein
MWHVHVHAMRTAVQTHAHTHVEGASRQAGTVEKLGELEGHHRRLFGGLSDNRVAHREREGHHLGEQHERSVERRDRADHPKRLAHNNRQPLVLVGWESVAVQPACLAARRA